MPRPFTETETAAIRRQLMDAGADAFAARGVRRTTVEDLARAAAISKGAFYRFFDSKEALFVALLDEYETNAHARIEAAVEQDPAQGLSLLVDTALRAVEDNPLIPVAMSEEGLRILRTRPEAERGEALERDVRLVRRIAPVLANAGGAAVSEQVLLGLLRSLVFVGMHRDDIGGPLVDDLADWLKAALGGGRHGNGQGDE